MAIPKFSYRNYFRPTPVNIQRWVEGIQGALAIVIGSLWFQDVSKDTLLLMALGGYGLDKISKFFARVAHDQGEEKNLTLSPSVAV